MRFAFDPDKDARNRRKHGLSLARAADLLWEKAVTKPDARQDYGEERFLAFAPMEDGRLHTVCYTWRQGLCRVISLRKANRREERHYARQTADHPGR